jgi:hypothetical protein
MADDMDLAATIADQHLARSINAARKPVPAGAPGICDECGDDMPRLIGGRCAPCRDGHRANTRIGKVRQ